MRTSRTELKLQEFGAYLATTARGKFEGLAYGRIPIAWYADWPLYRPYIQPDNMSHVNDPTFTAMFSHRSNPLLGEIQRRGRLRLAHETVPSDNVRALLRALRRNAAVWYAPDQTQKQGELVPFFGEPAMTSLATSKLARLSGAPVVPFSFRRTDDRGHYELEFHAPLRDFPTSDALADTHALVRMPHAAPESRAVCSRWAPAFLTETRAAVGGWSMLNRLG